MENTGTVSAPASPITRRSRSGAEWAGLAVLAVVVLVTGAFVGMFGPLVAVSCGSCPDGVRTPRFGDALMAVAQCGVPLTVLGVIAGMCHPRGGARVGVIGLGVLVALLILMQGL